MDEPTDNQARKRIDREFREWKRPPSAPLRGEQAPALRASELTDPTPLPSLPAIGTRMRKVYERVIGSAEAVTTSDIGLALDIEATIVSSNCFQLEQKGLLGRWYDPRTKTIRWCDPDKVPAGAARERPPKQKKAPKPTKAALASTPAAPPAPMTTKAGAARLPYHERRCLILERLAAITASDISAELRAVADFIRETHDA